MSAHSLLDIKREEADRFLHCLKLMAFIFWGANGRENWPHLLQQAQDLWGVPGSCPEFSNGDFSWCLQGQLSRGCLQGVAQELEEAYVALFINTRQGIAAPLYQSCFEEDSPRLNSAPAQRMQARLQEADLCLQKDLGHPADHLSIQLEYLYFLLSWALEEGDSSILQHAEDFSRLEMMPWVNKLEQSIIQVRGHEFFQESIQELARMLVFLQR
ncbi:MAG: molecular chaperone TorD family protein [Desulfohalobiaceae bacterium]